MSTHSVVGRLLINFLLLGILIFVVIVYFEYVASHVSANFQLIVGAGILPILVGTASVFSIRGTYLVKGVFASLVFPCSMLVLRFVFESGQSRDADSNILFLLYTMVVTGLTVVVVVFLYFFLVILREKHLSEKPEKYEKW